MFFPHDAIYFIKYTSTSCHPCTSPAGMVFSGLKLLLFRFCRSFHCGHTLASLSQHLYKVFCFSSEVETHISHQNTFISGTPTPLLLECYDGWTLPWRLCLHIIVLTDECVTFRHLEIGPKDQPEVLRSTDYSETS
ncbi:hypothetical protein XENORESO_016320 [Xenotaenia resolanae]|uniref:Uncharacterized protein n=1 Tax=Xenotaenia resolanae TaxID=208358 RepID=A0ABV0WH62_9TELE